MRKLICVLEMKEGFIYRNIRMNAEYNQIYKLSRNVLMTKSKYAKNWNPSSASKKLRSFYLKED